MSNNKITIFNNTVVISEAMIDMYKIARLSMIPSKMYFNMLEIDFLLVSEGLRELLKEETDIIGKCMSDGVMVYLIGTFGPSVSVGAENRLEQLMSDLISHMSDDANEDETDMYESY